MNELSLREVQQESIKVLKVIKSICEKENLKYSLAWGTLLGAVRHKGFIPWDDDVDIMMPREDYEKFIRYCVKHAEELQPYQLFHYSTKSDYLYVLSRFSDSRFTVNYHNVHNYGLGTFVDVYPLDGLGSSYSDAKKNMKRHRVNMRLIKVLEQDGFHASPDGMPRTLIKLLMYILAKCIGRNKLIRCLDKKCQVIRYTDSKYIGIPTVEIMESCILKKEWMDELIDTRFEDECFPIPKQYDELLKHRYGEYMKLPPKEQQVGHHDYSVYKK